MAKVVAEVALVSRQSCPTYTLSMSSLTFLFLIYLSDVGAIAGGTVGGVVGAALLALLAFFLWKRSRKPKPTALDEKMFDPTRTTLHSRNPSLPIDLVDEAPGGPEVSPYTAGMGGSKAAGYGGGAAAAGALGAGAAAGAGAGAGAGAAASRAQSHPSDPSYAGYGSRASMDSSAYDPYFQNMAGAGAGGQGVPNRVSGPADGYPMPQGYGGSPHPDEFGSQSPNRMSGGWGVAAALGSAGGAGYPRDPSRPDYPTNSSYHGYNNSYPYQQRSGPSAAAPPLPVGAGYYQDDEETLDNSTTYNPDRMSASALAKLREARGEDPNGAPLTSHPGADHHRRRSSHGLSSRQSAEGYGEDVMRNPNRNSIPLSLTSDNENVAGYRGNLVVHNDGGAVEHPDDDPEETLPAELPPT